MCTKNDNPKNSTKAEQKEAVGLMGLLGVCSNSIDKAIILQPYIESLSKPSKSRLYGFSVLVGFLKSQSHSWKPIIKLRKFFRQSTYS